MEELLPKDNENILPLFDDGPWVPSEPPGFRPDQMVRCEECLRANAPTRVSCLYCSARLLAGTSGAELQKPELKPLQKGEKTYHCIILPISIANLAEKNLGEASTLLKLARDDLGRIISAQRFLPVARTSVVAEADLVICRLKALGLETLVVSDEELGLEKSPPLRVRAASLDETGITLHQIARDNGARISWADLSLLVTGRLLVKQVEIRERKGGRADSQILDTSEFFTDESVLDIYAHSSEGNCRVLANNFDFSCLGERKSLLATENFRILLELIREYAPHAEYDNTYTSLRQALEPIWPAEQQTQSRGWRRELPGKYSVASLIETSNESQFLLYSRLRNYLTTHPLNKPDEVT